MALIEEAHKAARTLLDHAYVRIVARADPDAACAAALLAHALRRENVDFHVSWLPRLDDAAIATLRDERPDLVVAIGLAGDAAGPVIPAGRTIAIDSSPPTIAAEAAVHMDAAHASLAHLVAAGISKRNVDLAPLALAGALAAQRHIGGWRGLDAEILREAVDANVVLREAALALAGPSLLQALTQLDAPAIVGLSGRARNAKKLVSDLKLTQEALPGSLSADDAQRVGDFLALRILQQNAPDAALDALFRPTLRALAGPLTGLECGEMARVAEAACAGGRPGLAFASLWPDPSAAGEARDATAQMRDEIVAALIGAEREAKREGALLVAQAPRAALCRPLADRIAMSTSREATIVAVHAEDTVAIRSWSQNAAEIARKAAATAGAHSWGADGSATLTGPDTTRIVKAIAEALA